MVEVDFIRQGASVLVDASTLIQIEEGVLSNGQGSIDPARTAFRPAS